MTCQVLYFIPPSINVTVVDRRYQQISSQQVVDPKLNWADHHLERRGMTSDDLIRNGEVALIR